MERAVEKKVEKIIDDQGGAIYERTDEKIVGEFTCWKRAEGCCSEICRKLKSKVLAYRDGTRVVVAIG